ncbi:MAG: HPr family phosphocarrier protein [Oscillospiraceae bacterium]|jgi:phosphocarrier protein|nr:HPr family phosphocarrier protein [Oscillospiraceae bacterium]
MLNVQLEVRNELGIHARVASKITRCCQGFTSRIEADRDGKKLSLKNVLNVMLLNVKCGELLSLTIEGGDEADACASLRQLFAEKFGEK